MAAVKNSKQRILKKLTMTKKGLKNVKNNTKIICK